MSFLTDATFHKVTATAVIALRKSAYNDTPVISSRGIIPLQESVRYLPQAKAEAIVYPKDEEATAVIQVVPSSTIGGGQHHAANANIDVLLSQPTAAYTRRREAEFVSATILKPNQNARLGLKLKVQSGKVTIMAVVPTSEDGTPLLLGHSPFASGDQIVSVNGINCYGMNLPSVSRLLRQAHGTLTVVARRPTGDSRLVETMIEKPSKASMTGISIVKRSGPRRNTLKVSRIKQDGLFAPSLLNVGDKVLAVNQVDCRDMDVTSTVNIIRNAERYVTILTETLHTTGVVVAIGGGGGAAAAALGTQQQQQQGQHTHTTTGSAPSSEGGSSATTGRSRATTTTTSAQRRATTTASRAAPATSAPGGSANHSSRSGAATGARGTGGRSRRTAGLVVRSLIECLCSPF